MVKSQNILCYAYLMSTQRMKTLSKSTFLSGIKIVISKQVFEEAFNVFRKNNDFK